MGSRTGTLDPSQGKLFSSTVASSIVEEMAADFQDLEMVSAAETKIIRIISQ